MIAIVAMVAVFIVMPAPAPLAVVIVAPVVAPP